MDPKYVACSHMVDDVGYYATIEECYQTLWDEPSRDDIPLMVLAIGIIIFMIWLAR